MKKEERRKKKEEIYRKLLWKTEIKR